MSDILSSILSVLNARVAVTPEGGVPNPGIPLAIPKLAETLIAKLPWLTADRLEAYLSSVNTRYDNPAKVYQTISTITSLVANAADDTDAQARFEAEIARQSQATTNVASASTGGLEGWGAAPVTAGPVVSVADAVVAATAPVPAPAPAPAVIDVVAEEAAAPAAPVVAAEVAPAAATAVAEVAAPAPVVVAAAPAAPESSLAAVDSPTAALETPAAVVPVPEAPAAAASGSEDAAAADKGGKPKGTRRPRQANAHAQVPVSDPSKVLVTLLQAVRDRDAQIEKANATIAQLNAELEEARNRPAAAPQFALAEQDIHLLQELGIDLAAAQAQ